MKTIHLLTLLAAAVSLSACAAKREVPFRAGPGEPFTGKMARYDYTTYAAIPDTPTSSVYRRLLTAIPYTRDKAFYGNHAGSGNRGGKPVDQMDEIFRRHDIAYAEARSLRTLQMADAACVEALRRLDTSKMSPEGREFHARSVKFFSSQNLSLVGKPVSSYLIVREDKSCPFQTEGDVRALFDLPLAKQPAAGPVTETPPTTGLVAATQSRKTQLLAQVRSRPKHAAAPAAPVQLLLASQP